MTLHLGPVPSESPNASYKAIEGLLAELKAAALSQSPIAFERISDEISVLCRGYMLPGPGETPYDMELTDNERAIFELLSSKLGKSVHRECLLDVLPRHKGQRDDPNAKNIDVYICRIRKQMKRLKVPRQIETVWGQGYRMVAKPPS